MSDEIAGCTDQELIKLSIDPHHHRRELAMSALIKLSSKLPGDVETNGLEDLYQQMLADPKKVICAIAWIVPTQIAKKTETGEEIITVEMRRVEPISIVEKTPAEVQALAAKLYEDRTGMNPLPFEALIGREALIEVSEVMER